MKELELRDYQIASLDELRRGIAGGHHKQLVCAPTGSGKSMQAVSLAKKASERGSPTAFLVDRVSLTDQISRTFSEYGIEHGVIQANHWRFRPYELVQVISTGTLARRDLSGMRPFQLCITDEAHVVIKAVLKFYEDNPQMKVCALSATPFTKNLGAIYSSCINVTTTNKLIAEGWLAPLKVYAARPINMKGAKLKFDGEWEPTEIEKRSLDIIGDIVSGYVSKTDQHFGGPVKTIMFSATVAHGEELCRQFQAAGINIQQVSYKDGNDDKRRALIEEFRKPDSEIMGLVSCEALGRGFDVPDIKCMVLARPYRKSLSSHIQQIGRGMRPYPGKEFCLTLDHSSNWIRFREDADQFFEHGIHSLDNCDLDSKVRKEPEERSGISACGFCGFAMMRPSDETCPACGKARPKRKNTTEAKPGELVEVDLIKGKTGKALPAFLQNKALAQQELWGLALAKKPGDRIAAEKFALAQYRNIYNEWPRRAFRNIEPVECSYEISQRVKGNLIRFFKRKPPDSGPPPQEPLL